MKTRAVSFSEIARTPGRVLTAERYLLTPAEMQAALLAKIDARMQPLMVEREAILAARPEELRRRYAARFWKR